MAFSLKELKKQAGIEDVDFIKAKTLSDNEVVFCIHAIDDVESQFSKDGQWRLKISLVDASGETNFFLLTLAHDKKRDAFLPLVKQQIDAGEIDAQHSCILTSTSFKKGAKSYYDIVETEVPACECASHTTTNTSPLNALLAAPIDNNEES